MSPGEPYQLIAGNVALDFINTLDNRFRAEGSTELLQTIDDFARFAEQSRLLASEQAACLQGKSDLRLAGMRDIRELLSRIFYAVVDGQAPKPADVSALNRELLAGGARRQLRFGEGRWQWTWQKEGDFETLMARILYAAGELLTSEQLAKVRSCENATCRWLFLDTSRNHGRRWCDMKLCGNRMKARRFYEQHGKRERSGSARD